MDWFILALASFTLYGIQGFLMKVAAERRCNSFIVTFSFMLIVTIISYLIFVPSGVSTVSISRYFLFLVVANGTLFSLETITKLEILKKIKASIVFPFIRMSIILVILWAFLFAGEILTVRSGLGIVFSLIAIYLLESEVRK